MRITPTVRPLIALSALALLVGVGCGEDTDPTDPDPVEDATGPSPDPHPDPDDPDAAVERLTTPSLEPSTDDGGGAGLTVTDVRVGTHDGFDRIVLEIAGQGPAGWLVDTVSEPRTQGRGDPVDIDGAVFLEIIVRGVALPPDVTDQDPWDGERLAGPTGANVVELVEDTIFEGQHVFHVGLREQAPFGVVRLQDPQRIVVEVDHAAPDEAAWERCTNPTAGYTVAYPPGWHTNTANHLDQCQVFDPEPIDLPDQPRDLPLDLGVAIRLEPTAFDDLTAGDVGADITAEEDREVAGLPAVRQEMVATGDGLHPAGTAFTRYAVDHGGQTLVATSYDVGEPDYERKVEVLDQMMQALQID